MSTFDITVPGLYWPYRSYPDGLSDLARVRTDLARDLVGFEPDLVDAVQLVTSELVANSAKYARPGGEIIRTMCLLDGRTLRVAVSDPGGPTRPRIPTERTADEWDLAEGQRGLLLVQNLATSWGFHAFPEWSGYATQVWAAFDLDPT
ncbi:ATP-binding protein [Nocardiopsis sp. EMB25]|uniref:ATP-binding protein n=1 Tax=Nocardiopsis sp. EMB25 TaxID=2835867 RepID=UPI002284F5D5|nr:ATP-binding protein [Nocardiopsis sp. EMB25]MCY9787047.1 ATP-binding protein [Nocardiopsis sp. EMB25]